MELSITIDDMVYQKIMHWVKKANTFEVSGLGNIIVEGENLRVVDAILLEQENTSTETEISDRDIQKAMFHLKDSPGELRWWWHSHASMPVFWSGTDTGTIEELSSQGWFCATVFNTKEEMRSAYAQVSPVKMFVDNIDTFIFRNLDATLVNLWDDEYDSKVTVKPYITSPSGGNHSGYFSSNGGTQNEWWKEYTRKPEDLSEDEVQDIIEEVVGNKQGISWSEEYDEVQAALRKGEMG